MSQEVTRNFFKLLEADEVMQEQVKNANSSAGLIQIASDNGYEFTEEDFQAYTLEVINTGELTEEDLFAIAGGCNQQVVQQQQSRFADEAISDYSL